MDVTDATAFAANPTMLSEVLVEFRKRGRKPGRLRYGLSGGRPGSWRLEEGLARRTPSAPGGELWPKRAGRLRRPRLSRARARQPACGGRPAPAGQGSANLCRRWARDGDRRNRRNLHSRRLHEGILGTAGKNRAGLARGLAAHRRRRDSSIARVTSPCAGASPNSFSVAGVTWYPRDVEDALCELSGVLQASVIGVPTSNWARARWAA